MNSAAVLFFQTFTFQRYSPRSTSQLSGDGAFALGDVVALNTIQKSAGYAVFGVGSLAIEILDPLFIGTVTVTTSAAWRW